MLAAQTETDPGDQPLPPASVDGGDGAGLTALVDPAPAAADSTAPAPLGQTLAPGWKSADLAAANGFVQLLARAVHQFHIYPPTSPLCLDVIAACHKALAAITVEDKFTFRVTPGQLFVGELALATTPTVSIELIRRLHRAHVAEVTFDRGTPVRDLSRFCSDVSQVHGASLEAVTFAERLVDHGVTAIDARMADRPEVLEVGTPTAPVCDLVNNERLRRQEQALAGGQVHHLYPPDKGWIRIDPTVALESVSLVDLAIIVDDPSEIAAMLLRLTGENPVSPEERDTALANKFTEVAAIFAAAEPNLARVLFAKLARTVLNLDPACRKDLLKETILPGLLDGRVDGSVLADFPDLDLAEALCLLLDLETAAPELLSTALDRLALSDERRRALVPMLNDQLRNIAQQEHRGTNLALEGYAHKLLRIESDEDKSFAEYTSFDLAMDPQSAAVADGVRDVIAATDITVAQIVCLKGLVRLEPDPRLVEIFLGRSIALARAFETSNRWQDLADMLADYRVLGDSLRESRPDVADAITQSLAAFCTIERTSQFGDLHQRGGESRALATLILKALGPHAADPLARAIDNPALRSKGRALADLMADHATMLAPALALCLNSCGPPARRAILRVLGLAGHGYESAIIHQLDSTDEATCREALRALAKIGTPQASAAVAKQMTGGRDWVRPMAEEALWQFPRDVAIAQMRELLGRHEFVRGNPQLTVRMMDRVTGANVGGLANALEGLVSLRFRFWNPQVVRVARKAQELLRR